MKVGDRMPDSYDTWLNRDNPHEIEDMPDDYEEDDGGEAFDAEQAREEDSPWNDPVYRRYAERGDR